MVFIARVVLISRCFYSETLLYHIRRQKVNVIPIQSSTFFKHLLILLQCYCLQWLYTMLLLHLLYLLTYKTGSCIRRGAQFHTKLAVICFDPHIRHAKSKTLECRIFFVSSYIKCSLCLMLDSNDKLFFSLCFFALNQFCPLCT